LQFSASVDDHATVKFSPASTVLGLKEMLTVGGAGGATIRVMGLDVTLVLLSVGTLHVTDMTYVPDWNGAIVSVPCGSGREPNGPLLALLTIGRFGVEAKLQVDRFEFHVNVT